MKNVNRTICFALITVLAALITLLAACSSKGSYNDYAPEAEKPTASASGEVTDSSRKVIRDAVINAETKDYDACLTSLGDAVKELGGYVQSSETYGNGYSSRRSASMTLRIPADSLDAFIAKMGEIASVISESTSVKDVTYEYIDAESRLKALKTEEETLLGLLEKSDSLDSILAIQDRLTTVRASIESYEAQLRRLDGSIAYSTVNVYISEVERITVTEERSVWQKIGENLSDGFANVWLFLKGLFVFIISAVPYLLVIGAFAAAVLVIIHFARKRATKKRKGGGDQPPVQ